MTTATQPAKLQARIVGPAAPHGHAAALLGDKDPEVASEYQSFVSMRETVALLAKRVHESESRAATIAVANRPKKPARLIGRKVVGRDGRVRIKKDSIGDDNARPAPSTIGTDQDVDARAHDFVDDLLDPPYALDILASLYENSGPLRRNVDAMAANIDGYGYQFAPILDFAHPEVDNHIRDLMLLERIEEERLDLAKVEEFDDLKDLIPKLPEVKSRRKLWQLLAMVEKHRLHAYFESLNPTLSFTALRIMSRQNYELFGNAAWEVLRASRAPDAKITQIYNVPFASIRLVRADKVPTEVKIRFRKDATRWEEYTFQRFFRRYVRMTGVTRTYYKEFGDPRVVSRQSGRYYSDALELRREEGETAVPANEFLHFAIPSMISPYGIPRWMGALLPVIGNRASEEVNYLYFDNKAIPPMVLLCSGGRLSEDTVARLEAIFQERLKGRENFHKILIIEGIPAQANETAGDIEPSGKLRLEIKPLMGDQTQDALFQKYEENNELKIGRSFRQPPLLTGDQRDANRSTADVVRAVAEEQVYQPERDAFDATVDRVFLSNLGIRFWRYRTNAPVTRYPNDLVENAIKALVGGAIDPNEARALLSDAFSKEFPHRLEDWARIPPKLADAAAREGALPSAQPLAQDIASDAQAADAQAAGQGDGTGTSDGTTPNADGSSSSGANGGAQQGAAGAQGTVEQKNEGNVVARGRTSVEEDHSHPFVVLRDGEKARVVTAPAGTDGHTHPDEVVDFVPGSGVSEILEPVPDGDGHSHRVAFRFAATKRQETVKGFALAVRALQAGVREEVARAEKAKIDFFDPKTWGSSETDFFKREAELRARENGDGTAVSPTGG